MAWSQDGLTCLEHIFSLSWDAARALDERQLELGVSEQEDEQGEDRLTAGSKAKLRRAFEKALSGGMARRSALLWRLFVGFEVSWVNR